MNNISEGILQLNEAGREAGNLGTLQQESRNMAKEVSVSSEDTRKSSDKVVKMADQMHSLVKNTLEQANQIVQEAESQKEVTREVEESFHQVNSVSRSLMEIAGNQ